MAVKLIDELQKEIKAAGEAVTQEAYEKAYDHVFQILDNLEKLLNDNRYLEGNEITEEDKRLYDILIRFDAVYYFKQRLNRKAFARNQEAYEEAYHMVFNRLDWLEERLTDRRYLFGDKITESDVRLYVTLARFDVAYHNIFRVNKKRLRDYDNLWAYARDLYQTPGFGDTTDFAAIKKHYHIDCNPGNIHQIIAKGPDEEAWLLPHGREKLSEK